MTNVPGWQRRIALSLYKKEATYNAGVTINSANACEMNQFDSEARDFSDQVEDDSAEITGSEFPTTQEIIHQGFMLPYSEPKAKPNSLAGLGALVLGNITSTQDGALAAYRHKITPIAYGTTLPSIAAEIKDGTQWSATGIIGKSLKISGKEDGFVSLSAELVGSGTRATSATAFPAKITESWLKTTQMKVWLETDPNVSIDATPVQDAENISSGTPDDLKIRIRGFDFEWDNQPFLNYGYGSIVLQAADMGVRRSAKLSFSLLYKDDTELNYYLSQDNAVIEFDAKGGLIAAGGAMYYGFNLIVPRFRFKKIGLKGKAGDFLTQDYECTILNDGTNPEVILYVYTAKAAYLAA